LTTLKFLQGFKIPQKLLSPTNTALEFLIIKKYSDCYQLCEHPEQFIYFSGFSESRVLVGD